MRELEAGQVRERRFVADVSHELRTPLSALVGEVSLLKSRLDADPSVCPPDLVRLAYLVDQDVGRLRVLVDDLLEICRLDARSAESLIEPIDIAQFLERMVEAHGWAGDVSLQAPAGAHDPGRLGAEERTLVVMADRRRLERILVNLVENALTHGAAPVSVEARVAFETAGACAGAGAHPAQPGMVAVAVTDTGEGIALEDLPHVFDRFYKADPSRGSGRGAKRGSGLGLAIARENARLMGGELTVANTPGHGARFVLTLPSA
jgi:two-component system sensor histidine kinase MtrB